ncbi:MAG: AraC family transcriptional regulator [bacterium]
MHDDITCLNIGHLRPDPLWRLRALRHPHHELIVVLHGHMQVTAAGETIRAGTGDVMLYPAGVAHAEQADPREPPETMFCSFVAPGLRGRRVQLLHDHDGRMRQMVRWLRADQGEVNAAARDAFRQLFRALIAEFTRPNRQAVQPMADALRRQVQPRLEAPIRVAELAGQAGLSRYHFIRLYRRQTGYTPMAEVRRMRLDGARDMLVATALPLKEIARRCGLGSAQSFSRVFAMHHGQAPAAFRRAHQ